MSHRQHPNPAETYERYLGPTIADPWTHVLLTYAAPQPGERALDVACGTGSVARHVAPLVGAAGKVVALDVNPDMLAVARALPAPAGATIVWLEGNATRLDLPDDAFDLVLCQQGLQFFSDRAAALREMRRVLTDGGRVVISVWQALHRHPVYEALLQATARHLGLSIAAVDVSFSLGDADELRTLLSEAGFQRIAMTPRSLTVRLPEPERFVQLTVLGAATSIPAFTHLDAAARAALVEAVTGETQAVAQRYREGNTLAFPMSTHIAVAYTSWAGRGESLPNTGSQPTASSGG
jgi:ubiquinone/menaquinone biosynthesis C-methylase UbiE